MFKVIKDVISPPKDTTRQQVKDKYLLVKYHDRVGRMADTLEYTDVAFPTERFAPELIDELEREAPSLIEEEGDTLIVKHLYIERRMIPLNMYLDEASEDAGRGTRCANTATRSGNSLRPTSSPATCCSRISA